MHQRSKTWTVTVSTAGTPVRVIDDPQSPYRHATSAYFEALHDNSGSIFIGDESVSDELYATALEAKQGSLWNGDDDSALGVVRRKKIDLYQQWVDASMNGDAVNVTVSEDADE